MFASYLECMNGAAADNWLESVLSPLSSREFLASYWGKEFVHLQNSRAVEEMFSWNLLNSVLEQFPLSPPRLTLYKGGKEVSPGEFIEYQQPTTPGMPGRRLRSTEFVDALKRGATLVLNVADDMSSPLRNLTGEMERLFRVPVHANLYAGFGTENGFSLHWDNHDTLILQVAGRKAWTVYKPTYPHPLREEGAAVPEPQESPIWEGVAEEGSVIHMPRGWWHVAYPVGEPSLHVTIGVKSPMGLDLLRWVVNEKLSSPAFRRNIPLWDSPASQAEYIELLHRELMGDLEAGLLERFLGAMDTVMMPRPQFNLPESAHQNGLQLSDNAKLRLCCLRKFVIVHDPGGSGRVAFKAMKKTWRCRASFGSMLELLNDARCHAVGELLAAAGLNGSESNEAIGFLKELVENDILTLEK